MQNIKVLQKEVSHLKDKLANYERENSELKAKLGNQQATKFLSKVKVLNVYYFSNFFIKD